MIIKLSKDGEDLYSGAEIIAAFLEAGSFQISEKKAWRAREIKQEICYQPGSVQTTVRSSGAETFYSKFENEWIFGREKKWSSSPHYFFSFVLAPIKLEGKYQEVEVTIRDYSSNYILSSSSVTPDDSRFTKAQPYFDAFLGRFFEELEKVKTQQAQQASI